MTKPRRHRRSARRVNSPAPTILDSHPQVCQITDLSHDGRGVGRLAGKTYFVDGALPGETVEMRVWRHHRNYDEARLSKVLEPSLHRVDPACRHFAQCGGCSLQHFHWERQIDHKAQQLAASFERRGMLAKRWLPTLTAAPFG
jgi:23S rRNA (uracil1939-C5)-methyltransferase